MMRGVGYVHKATINRTVVVRAFDWPICKFIGVMFFGVIKLLSRKNT